MLKKLLKVGVVASLLIASTSVFAQEKQEYPRYGLGSNWLFGGNITYEQQFANGYSDFWRTSTNAGFGLIAQKQFRHDLDVRIHFNHAALWKRATWTPNGDKMSHHASLSFDLMWSPNQAWGGYDPDRRFTWYVFIGGGVGFDFSENDTKAYDFGTWGTLIDAGTGIAFRFTDHSSLFLEYQLNDVSDIPDFIGITTKGKARSDYLHGMVNLGYLYNIGLTQTDQAVSAQKSMLSQENFSALNSQVSTLENQVAASKNNEKKLENRIAELENELREARKAPKPVDNGEAEKRLKEAVAQLKADQLNFYAMPFSIQYDVNEWQVSEDQMDKVNAVAKVMKETDAKFMVVGFADYTGSDNYNQKLSERRANEVKRLLKQKGVPENKLTVEGKGKTASFGDVKLPVNRRVSFYRVIE